MKNIRVKRRNEIINSSEQGALKIEKQLPCKNKKNSYTIWQQKPMNPTIKDLKS